MCKHFKRSNGAYGKLGDRVLVAIMGQKKKGIIVGMKAKQRPGVPRFDSNNIVLIEENGNPSGNRITAPLPNTIRPILQKDSNPKKADYTKLFAIATKWFLWAIEMQIKCSEFVSLLLSSLII